MLARFYIRHGDAETRKRIIMMAQMLPVQQHVRRMAHAAEAQKQSAVFFRNEGLLIARLAPILRQLRNHFPDPRHNRGEFTLRSIQRRQPPYALQRNRLTKFMFSKQSKHEIIPPFICNLFQPFSAPTITPFAKNRCRKGYSTRIGTQEMTINAYLIESAYFASSPASVVEAASSEF